MGLRLKFNLVLLAAFLVGMALAAALSSHIVLDNARREVLQEAAILMRQALAVRSYTSQEILPLISDQLQLRFLPHSVPSWAAQAVLRAMQQDFPNYDYKEAAQNPTNPADRATDWESDIINIFRRDPRLGEFVSERDTPAGRILSLSRPFRLTDRDCLTCHSTPAAAPASMIDLYGSANGFGWRLGDVIGAQIVSVPMAVALERARRVEVLILASLACVFLLVMAMLNLLLHTLIVRPVRRISAMAKDVAEGQLEVPEYEPRGRDEIASLARSFNLMRRSLANAMRLLDD